MKKRIIGRDESLLLWMEFGLWSCGFGWRGLAWSGIHLGELKHSSMALVFGLSDTDPLQMKITSVFS